MISGERTLPVENLRGNQKVFITMIRSKSHDSEAIVMNPNQEVMSPKQKVVIPIRSKKLWIRIPKVMNSKQNVMKSVFNHIK